MFRDKTGKAYASRLGAMPLLQAGCNLAASADMAMMTIADCMSPFPHTIGPEQSLQTAHERMRCHKIRHLPVVDKGQLVGVVSQRDLYFLESLVEIDLTEVTVEEAMKNSAVAVAPTASLAEVAGLMIGRHVGSVVIMDGEEVVGIFTTTDALAVLFELSTLGEQLIGQAGNTVPIA